MQQLHELANFLNNNFPIGAAGVACILLGRYLYEFLEELKERKEYRRLKKIIDKLEV